jgi:hypothetical protein
MRYRLGPHQGGILRFATERSVPFHSGERREQAFPSLLTAISFHNPGELSGRAVGLIKRDQQLRFHRHYRTGFIIVAVGANAC